MQRILVVFYALTALSHLLFAAGIAFAASRLALPAPWIVGLAVAAPFAICFRWRFPRARGDVPIARARLLLIEEPYYAHWCACVLAMPCFVLAAPVALLIGQPVGAAALGSYLFTLVLSIYGITIRRRWVRVREIDVPIAGLGAGFEGYRVAQLSDLHIGGFWPRERAEAWVRKVAELDVDLVALTGDYVTRGEAFHEDIAAVLSRFKSRDGTYAVMGNHDYFGDGENLVGLLREKGISLLRNQRTVLTKEGSQLVLAGVEDTWTRRANVALTMRGLEATGPVIALAHDPQLFPQLAASGAQLVLSGHTHWGQIAMPFFAATINPSRLSYRYHAGIYREGASMLYVNPGLGTTGPPMRLGAAPEITVFRLCAAKA